MSSDRHQRLLEMFLQVCDLPPDERAERMAELADDDLRREVEVLLVNHDHPIRSLSEQQGCSGQGAWLLARELHEFDELRGPDARQSPETTLPEHIGPYRILRILGEGGMGIVYEAEQDEPRRRVALKVVHPALMTPALVRRFRREAEVLGRLRHPGIAQIFEAGTIAREDAEQPFLAMELCDGQSLLEFSAAHALKDSERLELVVGICEALQHAHDNGVIHRDLKPANILVETRAEGPSPGTAANALGDRRAQPKVLDFGVAQATYADARTVTMHTETGQVVGTLQYMSPEQASGDASQLDPRSDIYAVGVIMYQLLSGRLPYDLTGKPLLQAAQIIREQEPPRLGSVDRRFRGDIEAIAGKALEKELERRYASATALKDDVRRFLAHRPILARPPSALYRLRKLARRRTGLLASGTLAATGIVMATASILTLAWANGPLPSNVHAPKAGKIAPKEMLPTAPGIRFADDWLAANPEAEVHAFEEFFQGVDDRTTVCLSPAPFNEPVLLPLAGGTLEVSAFDGRGNPVCPIKDASTRARVADAVIPPGGTVVLEFTPAITAFYGMFGSVSLGDTVTGVLFSGGKAVGVISTEPSVDESRAQGYGFVTPVAIDRIELTSSEPGVVIAGSYRFPLEEPGLGTVELPGYDGPQGDDVQLDFACVFER